MSCEWLNAPQLGEEDIVTTSTLQLSRVAFSMLRGWDSSKKDKKVKG